ncbi:jg1269, partial [Pararge aegeria aegeria]
GARAALAARAELLAHAARCGHTYVSHTLPRASGELAGGNVSSLSVGVDTLFFLFHYELALGCNLS